VPERVKVLSFTLTPSKVIERKGKSEKGEKAERNPIAPHKGRGNGVARAKAIRLGFIATAGRSL
jgi:hypothetical protein